MRSGVAGVLDSYLRELYERVPVGVFAVAADGRLLLANDAFRELAGAAGIDGWLAGLEGPERGPTHAAWEACRSRGEPFRRDLEATRSGGARVWLRWRALKLSDGTIAGTLSDMTEIELAREQAASASRAKSDLLATMSHEIRTPLNSIVGMADLLWDTHLDTSQRKFAGVLREAGEHLLALINDLLDLSRIEAGELAIERRELNLREQMDRAVDLVAGRARAKQVEVHCRVAASVPQLALGDPLRLRQVLVNLLVNAVKFTERGEVVAQAELAGPGRVRFAVRDTGAGIAAEHLERIFRPFEQADRSIGRRYGGAGLGLSISRRLVELMGGRLEVESALGRGSTFHFELALPAVEPAIGRAEPMPATLRGLKVLVADENPTGRLILHEMVVGWGAAVEELVEPEGIVERAAAADVLVLARDLGAGGEQLVRRVRATRSPAQLGIVLIVGELSPGDDERQRELAVQALLKPVRRRELLDAIEATEPARRGGLRAAPASLAILLADDSADNQVLIEAFLFGSGHRLEVVGDGRAAADRAAAARWDLILIDLEMPVLDGLSAIREIRRVEREAGRPPVPILALTGHVDPEYAARSAAAGADGHLTKPITKTVLQGAIARAVQRAPEPAAERVRVEVTPTVAALVPGFLANRDKDARAARAALKRRDYHGLWVLAHTMKGLGASYGFDGITDVGALLEKSALAHDDPGVQRAIEALESYLGRVDYAVAS